LHRFWGISCAVFGWGFGIRRVVSRWGLKGKDEMMRTMKPRIAIPIPTTIDLPYNGRSRPAYVSAIARSGGEPVEIPLELSRTEMLQLVRSCQGACLPGSPADVNPAGYGQERDPATDLPDPAREAADFLILDEALAAGKPVLGICFGVQSLNVWRGGTLVQDLSPLPVNHAAGSKVAVAHAALIAADSMLASLLTADEAPAANGYLRLPINTSHHQSVAVPGDGLRVVARCPDDGVIEAVEWAPGTQKQWMIGVQWHPERSYEISAASRALFDRLVAEAAKFLPVEGA